jgi:hypothetical protein
LATDVEKQHEFQLVYHTLGLQVYFPVDFRNHFHLVGFFLQEINNNTEKSVRQEFKYLESKVFVDFAGKLEWRVILFELFNDDANP